MSYFYSIRLSLLVLFMYPLCTHSNDPNLKDWTFIIYMASDNDLQGFASHNLQQMAKIGSNAFINIVVQIDVKTDMHHKITRRYAIEKDTHIQVSHNEHKPPSFDSGSEETVISFCQWAITHYPAKQYALIFWNHGTGIIDPSSGRTLNALELFSLNPETNLLELDRTVGFFEAVSIPPEPCRGICWDDTTGNYLTNQKLQTALHHVCAHYLPKHKFDLIGFDACFMSMIEICDLVKPYAHFLVGSQEVELGTGWDYEAALSPFRHATINPKQLSQHLVTAYHQTYSRTTNDFTLSAIDLTLINELESNISTLGSLLIEALHQQLHNSVKHAIQSSRNRQHCTHFEEWSYIDLHDFYNNLHKHCDFFSLRGNNETVKMKNTIKATLEQGMALIQECVIANTTGKNLQRACGLSIYFPERRIHHSYKNSSFFLRNSWSNFLTAYLA
ncbi:MAG: clostripain-related cysteine peptidase [Candidatus Babeliales bacterium]